MHIVSFHGSVHNDRIYNLKYIKNPHPTPVSNIFKQDI